MLSPKLKSLLETQYNKELASGYFYMQIAEFYDRINLPGFAHFFKKQAEEENDHAMKFYQYIVDRGDRIIFQPISVLLGTEFKDFQGITDPMVAFVEHERKVTDAIEMLSTEAKIENDNRTYAFLHEFNIEQVEEVMMAEEMLSKTSLIKDDGAGILIYDLELAKAE